jgi:hypothetical protein
VPTDPAALTGHTVLAEQGGPTDPSRLVTLGDLNTALTAMLDNNRMRFTNSRLRSYEQWLPLKRERPQQVLPGGQLSAAPGLIPLRGQEDTVCTAEALHALSVHYGEPFVSWTAFEAFLKH